MTDSDDPWSLSKIAALFAEGDLFWRLCRPKDPSIKRDVREMILEGLVSAVAGDRFGPDHVIVRKRIAQTLRLRNASFPRRG